MRTTRRPGYLRSFGQYSFFGQAQIIDKDYLRPLQQYVIGGNYSELNGLIPQYMSRLAKEGYPRTVGVLGNILALIIPCPQNLCPNQQGGYPPLNRGVTDLFITAGGTLFNEINEKAKQAQVVLGPASAATIVDTTARDNEISTLLMQAYDADVRNVTPMAQGQGVVTSGATIGPALTDAIGKLSDAEKARFVKAIMTVTNLTRLNLMVVRWKTAAVIDGQAVQDTKGPDFLINTIQQDIPQIPSQTVQNYFQGQLNDLIAKRAQITPADIQSGAENFKSDDATVQQAAQDENKRLGPCAAQRETEALLLAASSPTLYGAFADKAGNLVDDGLLAIYSKIPFLPESFNSCQPPRWPLYAIIGIILAAVSYQLFKGSLRVMTFGMLGKKKKRKK